MLAGLAAGSALGQNTLFDFDNAPLHSPLPIDVTVDGITAHLWAGFYNYSVQRADALGFTPQGFGGNCIYPNTVFLEDLNIGFNKTLTDFSILYAPEEYGADTSATLRITAFMGAALVGTATTTAPNAGTWPTGILAFASPQGFDRVVLHYESPPIGAEDWGPIFMADNMRVTAVPEPATIAGIGLGLALVLRRKRR